MVLATAGSLVMRVVCTTTKDRKTCEWVGQVGAMLSGAWMPPRNRRLRVLAEQQW